MIEKVKSAMVGLGTLWVLVLMLLLSVISLAIMLERLWLYWTLRDDSAALMKDLGRLLRQGDLAGARRRLEASPSAEAAVVVAGIVEADMGADAAEEAMAGAAALQRIKLEKRLAFLGTLGNNAPFIGLLGTVIGIIRAFRALDAAQGRVSAHLLSEIGEALIATAVGLLVALPTIAFYNAFQRAVSARLVRADAFGREILAHLKSGG